eukprot:CAMPEP_0178684914 /NCGR_PEP_ID=MMETSP0699-20121125/3101_1 /TAXON_ID=265572 /ORGANISM="Extubocellulus spinifer, Strain CCMP396" /LENGTH=551 /DNA_ID=CAMNT_0020329627 /DNA_START=12 /DNA_END=1667 /DNA_ORIENTATION=-
MAAAASDRESSSGSSGVGVGVSMHNYGSTAATSSTIDDDLGPHRQQQPQDRRQEQEHGGDDISMSEKVGGGGERVAFLSSRNSTREYHQHQHQHKHHRHHSPTSHEQHRRADGHAHGHGRDHDDTATNTCNNTCINSKRAASPSSDSDTSDMFSSLSSRTGKATDSPIRRLAIDLSLWVNVLILLTKVVAYSMTLSLSVLAALTDSVLDVVSQLVLNYTEKHSSLSRSSAHYPAGASRLEPLGVLICAALMGMASFEIIKESCESLIFDRDTIATDEQDLTSFFSMLAVVVVKLALWILCNRAARTRIVTAVRSGKQSVKVADPTIEALAQDHFNDCLSNAVAAVALVAALKSEALWSLDPVGAILISLYIIYSWYETGKEQIEQLTGKSAPGTFLRSFLCDLFIYRYYNTICIYLCLECSDIMYQISFISSRGLFTISSPAATDDFIDEIMDIAANFDNKMIVDVCRAYHFGPKFLVELEVVLPRDTLLQESHDLGMDLQYEIEAMEEVERCFVHIDYETRPYDEHVVSKVPELRERILRQQSSSCIHSV